MTWANARDWRARADREARVFLAAALFLTRLPLRPAEFPPLPPLREAARHFGLVGALLGLAAGCVWGLAGMALPSALAALLAVGALLTVTGALHEDGLADCFDALGGRPGPAALEILRDSRIGSFGAAALAIALGLRTAALASFGAWEGVIALALAAALGRTTMVAAERLAHPARPDGLGAAFAGAGQPRNLLACAAVPGLIALVSGLGALAAALAGLAAGLLFLKLLAPRFGGFTGDLLGAAGVIAELATLVLLTAFWGSWT